MKRGKITGVSLFNLSSTYDTINHGLLLSTFFNKTRDNKFTHIVEKLVLRNERILTGKCNK